MLYLLPSLSKYFLIVNQEGTETDTVIVAFFENIDRDPENPVSLEIPFDLDNTTV